MKWLSNVCSSRGKKKRESRNWKPEALVCLKKRLNKFTFNNPTSSLNVFVFLRWGWPRCLETWLEQMFVPYTRGLWHSTLLISGPAIWLDSRWDENFTHISRRWLSSISAFSYAPHRHFQQRFLSSKTEVIVKKKVYLCLLSFFHRILLLSL